MIRNLFAPSPVSSTVYSAILQDIIQNIGRGQRLQKVGDSVTSKGRRIEPAALLSLVSGSSSPSK